VSLLQFGQLSVPLARGMVVMERDAA